MANIDSSNVIDNLGQNDYFRQFQGNIAMLIVTLDDTGNVIDHALYEKYTDAAPDDGTGNPPTTGTPYGTFHTNAVFGIRAAAPTLI